MNKLIKTTSIFILGVGLLTSCSHTAAHKVDNSNEAEKVVVSQKDENKDKSKNENNVSQENNENKAVQENNATNTITQDNTRDSNVVKENTQSNKITQKNVSDNKPAVKNDKEARNDNEPVKKEENKSSEQSAAQTTKNETATQKNNTYKHDFKEVEKLLNVIDYSLSNVKHSKMIDVIRFSVSNVNTENQVVYLPANSLLARLNTYNAGTYNVNTVLNKLSGEAGVSLVQVNKGKNEYTPAQLEKLVPNTSTVVYFKKDNMFAIRSVVGYGGASNSIFAPTENWKVEGDRVLIPYVTIATNKPTGLMTVRLNNKVYPNGQNKSMYYVESFVIY